MSAEQTEELANLNLFKDYTNVRPISQRREDDDVEEDELCELCQQELNGIQVSLACRDAHAYTRTRTHVVTQSNC